MVALAQHSALRETSDTPTVRFDLHLRLPSAAPALRSLLAKAFEGDREAYRNFLHAAAARLDAHYCAELEPKQRRELANATLLAAHEKRATCDPGRPVWPWLHAIAEYKRGCLGL